MGSRGPEARQANQGESRRRFGGTAVAEQSFPVGLQGRRVFITGGLGFIGSNLAHRCLELGARVTIYDCLDPRSGGNLFNIDDIRQDVELVMGDIRDFDCLSRHVPGHDLVFHCAAYTSHPNSMREPLIDVDVNCKGTLMLLEALRRFNPGARLIYLGTSTQVGRMYYRPIDDLHVEFPVDIYSANKLAGEKYCLIYARAYDLPVTVIRLGNVFGPRSNIRSPDFGFINYFIGLGLQGKEIPVFGEGRQLRNITYVEDCVEGLVLAAERYDDPDPVNLGTGEEITIRDLAALIARHTGYEGAIRWDRTKPNGQPRRRLDTSRAEERFGFRARVPLEEGIARTVAWYREHAQAAARR